MWRETLYFSSRIVSDNNVLWVEILFIRLKLLLGWNVIKSYLPCQPVERSAKRCRRAWDTETECEGNGAQIQIM